MALKFKDRTIYLSLMSLVTVLFTIVYMVLALDDTHGNYTETTKNIILVIVGAFFNNGSNIKTDAETKKE